MKLNYPIFIALSKQGQGQDLKMVFQNINQEQKERLLNYVVDWNSNGKYCLAAQVFINNFYLSTF